MGVCVHILCVLVEGHSATTTYVSRRDTREDNLKSHIILTLGSNLSVLSVKRGNTNNNC